MSPRRRKRAECELLLQGFLWEELSFPELARSCGIRTGQVGRELARCLEGRLPTPPGEGHPRADEVVLYWAGRSDLSSRRRRELATHFEACEACREVRHLAFRLLQAGGR